MKRPEVGARVFRHVYLTSLCVCTRPEDINSQMKRNQSYQGLEVAHAPSSQSKGR